MVEVFSDNFATKEQLQKINDMIVEVLGINRDRLIILARDVRWGYVELDKTEREIILDCLNLALALKQCSMIQVKI